MIDEDKTCTDCRIALPLNAPLRDGLCQQCHADLMRTLSKLERLEMEQPW